MGRNEAKLRVPERNIARRVQRLSLVKDRIDRPLNQLRPRRLREVMRQLLLQKCRDVLACIRQGGGRYAVDHLIDVALPLLKNGLLILDEGHTFLEALDRGLPTQGGL